ncbi:hypothetical protein, partial [Intestinimonas butyriciproducens]|uniref:hypothetical protein n=1 Tax=Intestinimonas butyriciproducens TaxID=1297617 RepID=UPI0034A1AA75
SSVDDSVPISSVDDSVPISSVDDSVPISSVDDSVPVIVGSECFSVLDEEGTDAMLLSGGNPTEPTQPVKETNITIISRKNAYTHLFN